GRAAWPARGSNPRPCSRSSNRRERCTSASAWSRSLLAPRASPLCHPAHDLIRKAVPTFRDHAEACSAADAEHERDGKANELIGEQEEDRRERREDEHHRGGDAGFLARRPGDLVGLLTHFLQE